MNDLIDECYFYIKDGGVKFSVDNTENGPAIQIKSTHFGHTTNSLNIFVKKEDLKKLGEMFMQASEQEYKQEYCCVARLV